MTSRDFSTGKCVALAASVQGHACTLMHAHSLLCINNMFEGGRNAGVEGCIQEHG